jgi:predicted amidophosphoribosyltransferase
MLCPSCGHENRAGRRFCVQCGAGLALACPSCGEPAKLTGDEAPREREFREAHRLFAEIGAPIRAAEAAKELGL